MGMVTLRGKAGEAAPYQVRYPTELTVSGTTVSAKFDVSDVSFPFEVWGGFMLSDTRLWNPGYIKYSPALLSVCGVIFGNTSDQQNKTGHCIRKHSSATEAGWSGDANYADGTTISVENGVLTLYSHLTNVQSGDTAGTVQAAYIYIKK